MTTLQEQEIVFPKGQRDLFPPAAQQLYIETYKQSWAMSAKGNSNQLTPESVASRDAWNAVKREFGQDPVTHKWHSMSDLAAQAAIPAVDHSVLGKLKRLFKR